MSDRTPLKSKFVEASSSTFKSVVDCWALNGVFLLLLSCYMHVFVGLSRRLPCSFLARSPTSLVPRCGAASRALSRPAFRTQRAPKLHDVICDLRSTLALEQSLSPTAIFSLSSRCPTPRSY